MNLLGAARVLQKHVVLVVDFRAAVGELASRAHRRVLVVLGTTCRTNILLRHVDIAVGKATLKNHGSTLPVVMASLVACVESANSSILLIWYLRVTLMHLVRLQHILDAIAQRDLTVVFLHTVDIGLNRVVGVVVHQIALVLSTSRFTRGEHHHLLLLVGHYLLLGHQLLHTGTATLRQIDCKLVHILLSAITAAEHLHH